MVSFLRLFCLCQSYDLQKTYRAVLVMHFAIGLCSKADPEDNSFHGPHRAQRPGNDVG